MAHEEVPSERHCTGQELDKYGLHAEEVWRECRPRLVEALEREGKLYSTLMQVSDNVVEMIEYLQRQGVPLATAENQAMREYIALPDFDEDEDDD